MTRPKSDAPIQRAVRTTEEAREYAMRPRRTYAWGDLRRLFVEGEPGADVNEAADSWHFPTLVEIARRYDLSVQRLRMRSAKDGWVAQRDEFKARLADTLAQRRAMEATKSIANTDARALATARIGASLVYDRVREIERDAATRAAARAEWEAIRDAARQESLTARAAVGERANQEGESSDVAMYDTRTVDDIQREAAEAMAEIDYDPWAPPVVDAREVKTLAEAAAAWHTLALRALGEAEIRRIEVSGPGGTPVQVQAATIYQELTRDDPARLHALMGAFGRAVLGIVDEEPLSLVAYADDGADPGDEPEPAA